jgi:sulfotransferase family protein
MQDRPGTSRPIFILGSPRSGTSLLSRMLNCHPRVCVPYEAHIYNVFWPFRDRYEPLSDPVRQRHLIEDVLAMRVFRDWANPPGVDAVAKRIERPNFHGVFEAVLGAWADGQGKPRWGEKTPQSGPYWRALHEGFADAQFVHLVRDGRDCAMSWVKARFGPKLIHPAAVRWAAYLDEMDELRHTLGPGRVHEIIYADLIDNTEGVLRSLCGFLGEEFDPAMLEFHSSPDNYMTDRRNRENLKHPVMKSNAGKWKTQMSLRDQRIFEAVAGKQLERYGYPLLHPGAVVTAWDRYRDGCLLHPPLRALAMLRNTKGWGDGLVRLRVQLRLLLTPRHKSG